jgi:hypothetical protein
MNDNDPGSRSTRSREALEQGQAHWTQAAATGQPCLVDTNETAARRADARSRLVHSRDRQQAGHTKIESTVRYLGIEIDDAIEIAEKIDV